VFGNKVVEYQTTGQTSPVSNAWAVLRPNITNSTLGQNQGMGRIKRNLEALKHEKMDLHCYESRD
jgi:hypothetical protein